MSENDNVNFENKDSEETKEVLDNSSNISSEEISTDPKPKKDPRIKWYVIHTYSGYEKKVKSNLEKKIKKSKESIGKTSEDNKDVSGKNLEDYIFRILVPTEDEIEFKDGKKKIIQKKIYPGYVLVEMIMDDYTWFVVRNTSGVTGFVGPVGSGVRPVPLPDDEVDKILRQMGLVEPAKVNLDISSGQLVKITKGPFEGFKGVVVNIERDKIKVLLTMFGRETPVEVEFNQVEKI
jgi:transcriptional antiterminator NusG